MSSDEESDYYLDDSISSYNWNSSRHSSPAKTEIDEMEEIELEEKNIKETTDK